MLRLISFALLLFAFSCNSSTDKKISANVSDKIEWMTWSEAIEANSKSPKKIFVDMYTHWCGWCKRMDARTFSDPDIAKKMNTYFYPVKFNAEQKEDIIYKGNTFSFVDKGRRGYHQLAGSLLDGKLSYPSFVFLNEDEKRILVSPGFKTVEQFDVEMDFVVHEEYKKQNLAEYKASKNTDAEVN